MPMTDCFVMGISCVFGFDDIILKNSLAEQNW